MKAVAMDTTDDSASQASEEQLVTLQIYVPELVVQKCMQFNREELIWDVKNQILAALPKELKEGFNYGLFCPPVNGRAGKFLDEERPLADYPFSDSGGYVELRYKRRIYKMNMEEKQLKQLHSRANLRRLLDHVHSCHVDKISKMCSRGLDPNFHCSESGESPLTLSTSVKHPAKVIMALVNGGAHLDFRTKDGCTVLHKAVEKNNLEALRTLLDLGSSPNYKDTRGLTTLYYSVLHNSDPQLTEMLLHDHAMIGTSDPHGWQEVHQACKYGLVQHLEHLLFYGADMNARNASGNTPLHVCAVNDQESCARVLLFRGADKGALNYANQNPHQVAVIAGNLRLAEIIKNHKTEDVVPYREAPRYNPRRRTSTANMGTLSHNHSDPRLELVLSGKPPSPCPSNHSLPHLSTSSDSAPQTADEHSNQGPSDCAESVGAGANSSGTDSDPFDSAKSTPLLESVCICIEEYNPSTSGHLQLSKGDLIEVIAVSGSGYLEGRRRDGEEGLFPAACIQEMPMKGAGGADTLPAGGRFRAEGRKNLNVKSCIDAPRKWKMFGEPRTVVLHKGKKGFGFILRGAKATSPLMERQPTEFWPSLQYLDDVDKGGVAEMAGLKKGDFLLEINGQDVSQASHEHVVAIIRQSGDLVSMTVVTVLQQPQMMLTPTERPQLINRQCATLPRKLSTKKAPLPPKRDPKTTLSVGRARARSMVAGLAEIEVLDHTLNEYDSEGRSTKSSSIESIPNKPSANATPESTPSTTTTTPSATTTTTPTSSQMPSSLRARPNSTRASVSELEDFFARHLSSSECPRGPIRNRFATIARIHRTRRRPLKRSKMTTSLHGDTDFRMPKNYSSMPELTVENITSFEFSVFQDVVPKRSRSFGDVPFLQARHAGRHSSRTAIAGREQSRQNHRPEKPLLRQHSIPETSRFSQNTVQYTKDRSSTPEISTPSVIKQNESDIYAETVPVNVKPLDKPLLPGRASCPPPSYPPPPPPVGQVIKVDVSRALGEYANLTVGRQHKPTAIMSSFRPTDSAKLYASPDAFMPVGYKKEHLQKCDVTLPRHLAKGAGLRSHSLPPKMPAASKVGACTTPGGRSTASLDTDHSSGDSTTGYPPFKTLHRSREHPVSESGHTHERANTLRKAKSGGASFGNKFQTGVPETSSPKHYPPLVQHGHDPFIPDPDYDSSDEEASTTEQKGGLVTFKALDNQSGSQEIAQAKGEKMKDKTENSSISFSKNERRRLKSQTSFDASQPSNSSNHLHETPAEAFADKLQGNANGNDPNSARNAPKETLKFPGSEVVLSEETGERIFIRNETHVNEDTRSEVKPVLEPAKELSDTAITQVKAQKVPPTPPPKRSDEASNQKLQGALPVTEGTRQNQESEKDAVLKAAVPRDLTIKDKTEVTVKSGGKESVPFKATIILKQTEVISKEIPFRVRNKELIHQHSAHELIHSRDAKGKGEEFLNRDIPCKETQWKEKMVRSPSQVLRNSTAENSPDISPHKDSLKETASTVMTKEKSEVSAPKVAPAVPKKPKVDDVKASEDLSELSDSSSTLQGELINADLDFVSPSVEMSTRSVRENIYNFEKRSELAAKNSFSPRRKSDVIRITLVGSQHKATEGRLEERGNAAQTMKTSKSCPKTFEEDTEIEDGNSSSSVSILSDMDVQVTRFSAETPTTTMSASSFADEWKRSEVVSPVMVSSHLTSSESVAKKPPDTPPKSSTIRKHDNINKQTTLGRRTPSSFRETENGEIEQVPFTGVMTLNRQSLSKGVPLQPVSLAGAAEVHRKMLQEHLTNAVRSKETAENNLPTSQPVKGLGHMPDHMMNVLARPRETSEHNAMTPQTAKFSGHPSELAVSALRARETTESNIMTPQSSKIVGHPSEHMMSSLRSREANEGNIMSPQTTKTMGPLSAQARLLENRNVRVPPPSSKGIQQNTANEDDECLRLCQRVDKSLQLIRLQVDTLGMAAVNEPETLSELVPPPPEFNFFPHAHGTGGGHHPPSATPLHIAPPPEFSDETLARQRRQHQQNLQNMFPPSARFSTPPSTMDMPVSRRVVPPDGASYTYVDHSYRSGYVQSPDAHPHHIPNIPNNMTSSPIKTMTISRGYPPHHLMHPPIRHDNNCSTLPHPSRMPTAYSRMEHPFSPGRSPRDVPHRMMNPATQSTQPTQLPHKEFRQKSLHQWSGKDVADWLESLFLPEYKICFAEAGITGSKLANMDNNDLMGLGVKQAGHRLNMERSIKWYLK